MHAAVLRTTPTSRAPCGPRRRPGWRRCPRGAGEVFEQAEDSALAFTAFPVAHWAKLRTNNVQSAPTARSSAATGSCSPSPRGESMLRLTREPHGDRGAVVPAA